MTPSKDNITPHDQGEGSVREMADWQPIETAPEDGHHYLAWCVDTVDEYDEDRLIAKGVKEEYACVAYYLWGNIVQFPFTGGIVRNRRFTHWMPLPMPPLADRRSPHNGGRNG
jgi:hypothetical protein